LDFEWDEEKRAITLQKHGFDFEDVVGIFDSLVIEWESPREGEHRTKATGVLEKRCVTVIYTWRGDRRRIISARAARKGERELYEQA